MHDLTRRRSMAFSSPTYIHIDQCNITSGSYYILAFFSLSSVVQYSSTRKWIPKLQNERGKNKCFTRRSDWLMSAYHWYVTCISRLDTDMNSYNMRIHTRLHIITYIARCSDIYTYNISAIYYYKYKSLQICCCNFVCVFFFFLSSFLSFFSDE